MIRYLLMALVCLLTTSCTKEEILDAINEPGDTTVVKLNYNKTTPLRNPLNGWVMYAARTATDSYWDTELYVPELGKKVKAIDYTAACYIRTSWASLNPSNGVYTWNDPNSQLGKLIAGAEKRGVPIAFRIVVDGRDQGLNTPQFVFDAGAQYYVENPSFPTWKTPYPQDPIFRQYYTKFIEALGKRFNDAARTSFIDGYGLGKWGEAHNVIYAPPGTLTAAETEVVKEEVMDWVTDLYARCFTKVPLAINYHRVVGHPTSWGSLNPNTERLLTDAINKGYCLRQDAFGMTDYYQSWEKQFAKTWNNKRPILMEGGWITTGTHRYWIDPSGKYRENHPEDVRLGEFDASAEAKVNMMDFRVGEINSWFEKTFPLVQRFVSEGGYRLYPDQVSVPRVIKKGTEATISHRWRNMGWGYCPNNLPQWNYKYKVAFALLDVRNNVKKLFVDSNSEPSNWLKDNPVSYNFKTVVDAAPGKYTWAVAIVDTSEDNEPGIKLAVNNETTRSGWVKLAELQVQ